MFAQAAAAQVNSISALVTAALGGLVGGSAVLIAQYWGKKDMERIKQVFAVVMWICCGVALHGGSSTEAVSTAMVGLVIDRQDTRITALTLSYLGIVCFPTCFAVSTALVGMLRTIESTHHHVYRFLCAGSNIGLNYVLIFGETGISGFGYPGSRLSAQCWHASASGSSAALYIQGTEADPG